jgi:hypothetical protein
MPQQPSSTDQTRPNRAPNKEKADGSRETTNAAGRGGGITNQPLAKEEDNHERVPPGSEA